ncbi:formimidoylglutamate deiminase [Microbacterium sp. NPDC055357]
MGTFWLEHAAIGDDVVAGVRLIERDGIIVDHVVEESPREGDAQLRGLTVPGFANAHSHAFHRVLRGRLSHDAGDFWSWRTLMYHAVTRLDVDLYRRTATAVYAEMVLAGYTVVGEFHYVHHRPDGRPHDVVNAMGHALIEAARDAGIRLTLLDTMYLRGGLDEDGRSVPLEPAQRRFSDRDIEGWFARHDGLSAGPLVQIGAAIHSVRAVDVRGLGRIAARLQQRPVHAHVSEQPRENQQALAAYGCTPVQALEEAGLLGPAFTAVHATHLTDEDVQALASSGSTVCFCPTTERDLADGIGPARVLVEAGVRLAIGSDQHVIVDPFDELRALEGHERLASGRRSNFSPSQLQRIGGSNGYASLGWNGGRIERGAVCDLVTIDTRSVRTAGALPDQVWLSAAASDVRDVVVAGRPLVANGRHRLGDVDEMLAAVVDEVFR